MSCCFLYIFLYPLYEIWFVRSSIICSIYHVQEINQWNFLGRDSKRLYWNYCHVHNAKKKHIFNLICDLTLDYLGKNPIQDSRNSRTIRRFFYHAIKSEGGFRQVMTQNPISIQPYLVVFLFLCTNNNIFIEDSNQCYYSNYNYKFIGSNGDISLIISK